MGNLNAERDWGHAKDYVDAMWRMLQHSLPEDFVIATGKKTSVRDFCSMAFEAAGMTISFRGQGKKEVGIIDAFNNSDLKVKIGQTVVEVDSRYYRPTEVELLLGNATKAKEKLGWQPTYTLSEMVKEMVSKDLELFQQEVLLKRSGYSLTPNKES